jgi:hypothetical protein
MQTQKHAPDFAATSSPHRPFFPSFYTQNTVFPRPSLNTTSYPSPLCCFGMPGKRLNASACSEPGG